MEANTILNFHEHFQLPAAEYTPPFYIFFEIGKITWWVAFPDIYRLHTRNYFQVIVSGFVQPAAVSSREPGSLHFPFRQIEATFSVSHWLLITDSAARDILPLDNLSSAGASFEKVFSPPYLRGKPYFFLSIKNSDKLKKKKKPKNNCLSHGDFGIIYFPVLYRFELNEKNNGSRCMISLRETTIFANSKSIVSPLFIRK